LLNFYKNTPATVPSATANWNVSMIGRIHGTLIDKQSPDLLVDVNGVAYEIQAPMTTIYRLPEVGATVTLFTHFVVREDAQLLFGFYDKNERSLFRSLLKVNGVGPKMALAILSGIEAQEFVRCVAESDITSLTRIPGVGKKTAERLLVEMRDRLKEWQHAPTAHGTQPTKVISPQNQMIADAESALVALGYKPAEATKAITAVLEQHGTSSETLIRAALKRMVQ
jgi:Holliday junction DNA helicase RuvA